MDNEKILSIIREVIAEIGEIDDPDSIGPDAHFIDDLQLDSMLLLEVLGELERRFEISIPEEEFPNMVTLNQCVATATKYMNA